MKSRAFSGPPNARFVVQSPAQDTKRSSGSARGLSRQTEPRPTWPIRRQPSISSANLKFAPDEQSLKCAVAPDAFAALDNAWGRRGWTRATLAALSEPELSAALEMAWRHGATKAKRRGTGWEKPR